MTGINRHLVWAQEDSKFLQEVEKISNAFAAVSLPVYTLHASPMSNEWPITAPSTPSPVKKTRKGEYSAGPFKANNVVCFSSSV
jgi:hypothetical protein